jgi:hypothetical protein
MSEVGLQRSTPAGLAWLAAAGAAIAAGGLALWCTGLLLLRVLASILS